MVVLLIGTLDTKGQELGFARDLLRSRGLETIVVDVGSGGPPTIEPDVPRDEVLRRAGTTAEAIRAGGDRGAAVAAMARGIAPLVSERVERGEVDGVFGLGGSAGTVIASAAMRALPFGLPKVLVSTLASGQTRPFLEGSDIALFPPVADLAGLNRLTRTALANAAHALAGMLQFRTAAGPAVAAGRPLVVAATMFGVTTRCVARAREALERLGREAGRAVEVLVFHATGVGGRAMESLVRDGLVDAVLDLTTTELADEEVGGILSAGPDRLEAAVARGLPQVVSVGALDMVNFGPRSTVPARFEGRTFHVHNPSVTLMRTTPEENARIGARMAAALGRATAPTAVVLPAGGVSALDVPGAPWHDAAADRALFDAIRVGLEGHPVVAVEERPEAINDPAFADHLARRLLELIHAANPTERPGATA